ncbi:hypothetical protein [Vibrio phage VCPH]|nr:hypothetical protein [Vibrio phage VCPH]
MRKQSKRAKLLKQPEYAEKTFVQRRTGMSKILMVLARGSDVKADAPAVFYLGAQTGLF